MFAVTATLLCNAIAVQKLTLVFEFLDQDLKKYLDVCENGMEPQIIKWFLFQLLQVSVDMCAKPISRVSCLHMFSLVPRASSFV